MKRTLTSMLVAGALCLATAGPSHALKVFDSANFAQNILTAARTLEMTRNQIEQLANEADMLRKQETNLRRLGFSAGPEIDAALREIRALMTHAEALAFDVTAVEAEYRRLYPKQYRSALANNALLADALERWRLSRVAFEQDMVVQSQIVAAVERDSALLDRLVAESQASVGALQARQAGNQIMALSAKQQLQTQEMLAAHFRAQSLEQARAAMEEERGRARFARFIGDGDAYTRRPRP